MANNAQKTPIARRLEAWGQNKAAAAIALTGKSLPASVVSRSGAFVTVKFEIAITANSPYTLPNITVPMIGSEYIRLPIQPGCLGWVMTADAYLGAMSGEGAGVADLSLQANLSCLVWSPIGNKNWTASDDDNAIVLYGPDGGILRSTDKTASLTVTKTLNKWTAPAGAPITLEGNVIITGNLQLGGAIEAQNGGTYTGDLKTGGNVIAGVGTGDQVGLKTHTHGGVTTGSGTSGAPTPGT